MGLQGHIFFFLASGSNSCCHKRVVRKPVKVSGSMLLTLNLPFLAVLYKASYLLDKYDRLFL